MEMEIDSGMHDMVANVELICRSGNLVDEVKDIISKKQPHAKIPAIKHVRDVLHMGLKEAKDAVEEIMLHPDWYHPTSEKIDILEAVLQHIRSKAAEEFLNENEGLATYLRDLAKNIDKKFRG